MPADTSFPPTEALAVLARWGIQVRPTDIAPGSGTANASVVVSSSEGKLMLRRRNPRYAREDWVRFDHALLAHLAQDGIPAPRGVAGAMGGSWLREGDAIYELFEFIDGDPHREGDATEIMAAGRMLAEIHRSTASFDPPVAKPWPRFHDPKQARDDLAELLSGANDRTQATVLEEALALADALADRLTDEAYQALPQTVVHGDYHPANLKFRGGEVAGVFDWDWASLQPRLVDVVDGLLFFCGVRDTPLVAGDIWSLTEAFEIASERVDHFLDGYQSVTALAENERCALPDLMRCRWLYCRVDAAIRKVPADRRVAFVTRDLRRPLDGIDALEAKLRGR